MYCPKSFIKKARKVIRKKLSFVNSRPIFLNNKRLRILSLLVKIIPGNRKIYMQKFIRTLRQGMEIMSGKPNEIAMPLCYWRSGEKPAQGNFDPANDGCGLMWYMALVPMKKDIVTCYSEMAKKVCLDNDIDPFITLTTVSEQCFESTIPILFDRNNKDSLIRAQKCYDELFEGGKKIGVLPNRLSIEHMHYFETTAPEATDLIRKLHKALDPERIMSPGRYGV